jgi:putative ATP-dependent endonuclease of OLD family
LLQAAARELDDSIRDEDAQLLPFADEHKEELAVRLSRQIRVNAQVDSIPVEFRQLFVNLGELNE